jgi:hypothetical protein
MRQPEEYRAILHVVRGVNCQRGQEQHGSKRKGQKFHCVVFIVLPEQTVKSKSWVRDEQRYLTGKASR